MNKYIKAIKKKIKECKRKLIKVSLILVSIVAGFGIIGGIAVYNITKSNIIYTASEAQEIALQSVQGEVLSYKKDFDLDDFCLEYEFKIRDTNNRLVEVTVDSKLGVITDIDK